MQLVLRDCGRSERHHQGQRKHYPKHHHLPISPIESAYFWLQHTTQTLIHILALPAQLRNNFCLSFREKNRSRTPEVLSDRSTTLSRMLTISTCRIHLDRILHFAREKGCHCLCLVLHELCCIHPEKWRDLRHPIPNKLETKGWWIRLGIPNEFPR